MLGIGRGLNSAMRDVGNVMHGLLFMGKRKKKKIYNEQVEWRRQWDQINPDILWVILLHIGQDFEFLPTIFYKKQILSNNPKWILCLCY